MNEKRAGIAVKPVFIRHQRRILHETKQTVQDGFIRLEVRGGTVIHNPDITVGKHPRHLVPPAFQKRPMFHGNRHETGGTAGIQARLRTLPDIPAPGFQHFVGNPTAGIGINIQILPQGTPPDTDVILIRRSQQRRTVAAEKAVAVHPGRIIRLRKQQRLRLPAGLGAAAR